MDTDDNPSGYFVKAKVDGKLVEFKTATLLDGAIGSSIQGVYDFTMSGGRQVSGQSALNEFITIVLRNTSPITEKTYSGLSPFEYGFKGVIDFWLIVHFFVTFLGEQKSKNNFCYNLYTLRYTRYILIVGWVVTLHMYMYNFIIKPNFFGFLFGKNHCNSNS